MWWGRTTANSAEGNGCTGLRVGDNNPSYRRATKEGQASRNQMLDWANESAANARYRLPILDNTLSILPDLSELLLNIVVVGRECGENESQNSKNTDESEHRMSVGTVASLQRRGRTRAATAFAHEIHCSLQLEPWVRPKTAGGTGPAVALEVSDTGKRFLNPGGVLVGNTCMLLHPDCQQ
jgi:hypothetical protein